MDYVFICKNCGNSQNIDWSKGTFGLKCDKCRHDLSWKDAFPPQTAISFSDTTNELYNLCKKRDKENKETQIEYLKTYGLTIDKSVLDKYINQYEKHLEKFPYNNDGLWQGIDDQFEDELAKSLSVNETAMMLVMVRNASKNGFRTAYVIMLASLIEQLFNNYFEELLELNLTEYGRIKFLEKYETAGIQSVIDISNSFLDESITDKMDRYSKGFSDRWKSLRELRNSIVHSNDKYISKVRLSKIKHLKDESYKVFLGLKKELYSRQDN